MAGNLANKAAILDVEFPHWEISQHEEVTVYRKLGHWLVWQAVDYSLRQRFGVPKLRRLQDGRIDGK